MYEMSLEMSSAVKTTLDQWYYTQLEVNIFKSRYFHESCGGHLGFLPISKIAQCCQSGNQAKFDMGHHIKIFMQKNPLKYQTNLGSTI